MNKNLGTMIGLIVGLALGFAGAFGGFSAFLIVLVMAILGIAVGSVVDGRINLDDFTGGRSGRGNR